MWAHYADKHTGLALGFDVQDELASEVIYTNEKIRVPFGKHLPKHGLTADLLTQIRNTKASDWSYEREYRLGGGLKTADPLTGLYYTDFGVQLQLREVIIGYRCSWSVPKSRTLVGEVHWPVRICKARPAFGKFEMIEQRRVKPVLVMPTKA